MLSLLMALSVTAAPTVVEPGKSIAGVSIGMTRAEVEKLHTLKPEGVERAERVGYVSGPLLFLFTPQDKVALVSLELQKTAGIRVGKIVIPAKISAADFAKKLPNCTVSQGSGGQAVHCEPGLDAYDTSGAKFLSWVHLGPG
ncbi:MAG: hypothetical protein ACO1OB_23845 [Archangium sp.]